MNQATYAAATADLGCIGQTIWLDMNAKMDQWRNAALTADGDNVIHEDGIHPNVWGQMLMTGEIMKAIGLRPYIADVPSALALEIGRATWREGRGRYVYSSVDARAS